MRIRHNTGDYRSIGTFGHTKGQYGPSLTAIELLLINQRHDWWQERYHGQSWLD